MHIGWGGLQLEDTIVVEADGFRSLDPTRPRSPRPAGLMPPAALPSPHHSRCPARCQVHRPPSITASFRHLRGRHGSGPRPSGVASSTSSRSADGSPTPRSWATWSDIPGRSWRSPGSTSPAACRSSSSATSDRSSAACGGLRASGVRPSVSRRQDLDAAIQRAPSAAGATWPASHRWRSPGARIRALGTPTSAIPTASRSSSGSRPRLITHRLVGIDRSPARRSATSAPPRPRGPGHGGRRGWGSSAPSRR